MGSFPTPRGLHAPLLLLLGVGLNGLGGCPGGTPAGPGMPEPPASPLVQEEPSPTSEFGTTPEQPLNPFQFSSELTQPEGEVVIAGSGVPFGVEKSAILTLDIPADQVLTLAVTAQARPAADTNAPVIEFLNPELADQPWSVLADGTLQHAFRFPEGGQLKLRFTNHGPTSTTLYPEAVHWTYKAEWRELRSAEDLAAADLATAPPIIPGETVRGQFAAPASVEGYAEFYYRIDIPTDNVLEYTLRTSSDKYGSWPGSYVGIYVPNSPVGHSHSISQPVAQGRLVNLADHAEAYMYVVAYGRPDGADSPALFRFELTITAPNPVAISLSSFQTFSYSGLDEPMYAGHRWFLLASFDTWAREVVWDYGGGVEAHLFSENLWNSSRRGVQLGPPGTYFGLVRASNNVAEMAPFPFTYTVEAGVPDVSGIWPEAPIKVFGTPIQLIPEVGGRVEQTEWEFPADCVPQSSTEFAPTVTFGHLSSNTVRVRVGNAAGWSPWLEKTLNVQVHPDAPVILGIDPPTICAGEAFTLEAPIQGTVTRFDWQIGEELRHESSPLIEAQETGILPVTLTVWNQFGASHSRSMQLPITAPEVLCWRSFPVRNSASWIYEPIIMLPLGRPLILWRDQQGLMASRALVNQPTSLADWVTYPIAEHLPGFGPTLRATDTTDTIFGLIGFVAPGSVFFQSRHLDPVSSADWRVTPSPHKKIYSLGITSHQNRPALLLEYEETRTLFQSRVESPEGAEDWTVSDTGLPGWAYSPVALTSDGSRLGAAFIQWGYPRYIHFAYSVTDQPAQPTDWLTAPIPGSEKLGLNSTHIHDDRLLLLASIPGTAKLFAASSRVPRLASDWTEVPLPALRPQAEEYARFGISQTELLLSARATSGNTQLWRSPGGLPGAATDWELLPLQHSMPLAHALPFDDGQSLNVLCVGRWDYPYLYQSFMMRLQ